jgi:hypothetical protein
MTMKQCAIVGDNLSYSYSSTTIITTKYLETLAIRKSHQLSFSVNVNAGMSKGSSLIHSEGGIVAYLQDLVPVAELLHI